MIIIFFSHHNDPSDQIILFSLYRWQQEVRECSQVMQLVGQRKIRTSILLSIKQNSVELIAA